VTTLEAVGYDVEYLDLYASRWAPVLDRDEFGPVDGPFKPQREQWDAFHAGTLAEDVREGLDAVFRADLLVLSFPLWWFSVPAILKGWLDRVFAMGAVSGGDAGLFETAALRGRRAVVLTTTGGPAAAFTPGGAFGGLDEFLFPINRGVLEFVGYDALEPIVTFGPAHLDDAARRAALDRVRAAVAELDARPLASTNRSRRFADTH
jgi:NAD(P)H dehydrogenase (quinone)